MINVKLGDIFLVKDVLPKLLASELKIKTLINVERMVIKINKELEFIEARRNELVKKYGEEINPGEYQVKEHFEIFTKEFSEMLETEIEVSEINKLEVDDVADVMLNSKEYLMIKPFLNL